MDCIEGYNDRLRQAREETDMLNHILGRYISFATHDPKHYPKEPALQKAEEVEKNTARTDDQRIRMARLKYSKKE